MSFIQPLVSVGICTYNAEVKIVQTLDSVFNQSYQNIEIFVLDDCSTDNTFNVIKLWAINKTNVVVLKNKINLGVVKNCNILLTYFTGKFFQFLGHDDIIFPDKIYSQIDLLRKTNYDAALVFSDVQTIDEENKLLSLSYLNNHGYNVENFPLHDLTGELLKFNFIPSISVLLSLKLVKELGGYDESIALEDLYMWLKLSTTNTFLFQPHVTGQYRIVQSSMMHNINSRISILASTLELRERYRGFNTSWDNIINEGIKKSAPAIYRYNKKKGKLWLKTRLLHDKSIKSYLYRIMSVFKIGYFWK